MKKDNTKKDEQKKDAQKSGTVTLEGEIETWKNKYLRALADYQNLERRISENRLEERSLAAGQFILKFLPVLDDLSKAEKDLKNEGLKLILKKAEDTLKSEGVEKIEVEGKFFDPQSMECVDVASGETENKVVSEVRTGYRQSNRILRAAQVIVGKNGNQPASAESSGEAKEEVKKVNPD